MDIEYVNDVTFCRKFGLLFLSTLTSMVRGWGYRYISQLLVSLYHRLQKNLVQYPSNNNIDYSKSTHILLYFLEYIEMCN